MNDDAHSLIRDIAALTAGLDPIRASKSSKQRIGRLELLSLELQEPEPDQRMLLGLCLGYPLCCIHYFIHRSDQFALGNLIPVPDEWPLIGTGFVPCPKCADKSEDQLREYIAEHRLDPIPFPDSNPHECCDEDDIEYEEIPRTVAWAIVRSQPDADCNHS